MVMKYFKSERVLLNGRFTPATLAVEQGIIKEILDHSFSGPDEENIENFGQ